MNYPKRILVLDVETTDLNSMYDYITQLGAAIMEDGEVLETFSADIQPNPDKFKIKAEALKVQVGEFFDEEGEFKPEMAAKIADWFKDKLTAKTANSVAQDFVAWCKLHGVQNIPNVAHNAAFDAGFINQWKFQQAKTFKDGSISPVWIDTMELARSLNPGGPPAGYSLDALCVQFGLVKRKGGHNALQDAILCGQVYFKCLERMKEGVPV